MKDLIEDSLNAHLLWKKRLSEMRLDKTKSDLTIDDKGRLCAKYDGLYIFSAFDFSSFIEVLGVLEKSWIENAVFKRAEELKHAEERGRLLGELFGNRRLLRFLTQS